MHDLYVGAWAQCLRFICESNKKSETIQSKKKNAITCSKITRMKYIYIYFFIRVRLSLLTVCYII